MVHFASLATGDCTSGGSPLRRLHPSVSGKHIDLGFVIYKPNENVVMKKLLLIFIPISISICDLYPQNKTIKGRVISEHLDVLTGVSIMIYDSVEVGRTDVNGFFQIDFPISEENITFSFVGMESLTVDLDDKCDVLEVVMMYLYSYDFITLRRA